MTHSSARRRAIRPTLALLLLAATAVAAWLGGRAVRAVPVAFDGGFNLQVARTLVEKGRYATTYRGLTDFDHRVQTGPAVIVPTAVALRRLGVSATTAQLANLAYLVALFPLAAVYGYRRGGLVAAALAPLALLGIPQLFVLGLGMLGEVPAVVFFLAGLIAVDLHVDRGWRTAAFAAGACFGLALSTKFMLLLGVATVAPVALVDRWTGRRLTRASWAVMAAGFAAALGPFELYRLKVLSWPGFLEWWQVMARRAFTQGTSIGMPGPDAGLAKAGTHLAVLARAFDLPLWLALAVVTAPLLLLLAGLLADRRARRGGGLLAEPSVAVLAAAFLALLGWWMAVSPTSHTWLRRALPGLILLAVLSAVAGADGGRRLLALAREGGSDDRRRLTGAAAAALGGLALVWLWLAAAGVTAAAGLVEPTPERGWTEVMVDRINRLPRSAALYATGWYEAPVLAALTGRRFHDLDQFPLSRYRLPLHETYFVVDHHLSGNRPDEVAAVLARSSHELVQEVGRCFLYRLDRLEPYPPLPAVGAASELPTRYRPGEGGSPWVGGMGTEPGTTSWARAVSGFLLDRRDLGCLELDLWVPHERGRVKVLQVRVDGRAELTARLDDDSPWHGTVRLTGGAAEPGRGSLVELWVFRFGAAPSWQLWFDDLGTLVVREVGFAPCSDGVAPEESGAAPGPDR